MTNTSEASRPAVWQGDGPGLRNHCRSGAKGMAPQSHCPTADQRQGSYSLPYRVGNREIWNGKSKPRTQCRAFSAAENAHQKRNLAADATLSSLNRHGGLVMPNRCGQKTTAMREVLASNDVRTLIANQLGVDVKRAADEAHFANDLGTDWLDRLEFNDCDRTSVRGRRNHGRGCRPDRSRGRSNPPHRKRGE
jgi:hypothetical protein